MSTARNHVEWLSLIETSGPFLSLPILLEVFPQGLDKPEDEGDVLSDVRLAHAEWTQAFQRRAIEPKIHRAWILHVLKNVLQLAPEFLLEGQNIQQTLRADFPEQGETLRPDFVLRDSESDSPRLLIQVYPSAQNLNRAVVGKRWQASPSSRMMELLHSTGCVLGLATNGEQWMLVYAPKNETTGFASWYATLWQEEPVTFRAFRALLSQSRFTGVEKARTLEELFRRSAANQQEVTDQLGYQVRRAVEVLVQALDRADRDTKGKLLKDVSEARLYEAAVTVMMRLVFLMCAEERKLLPIDDALYADNYAISPIMEQLQQSADLHDEVVLEGRNDVWHRLLAAFRAVHGGIRHDRLRLPAYGGSLFDPDRFPFLEGRADRTEWQNTPAQPLPVNNRVALHLLRALQRLDVRLPGGGPAESRRMSFRALDIEQIGHVYEGLLDHTAKRAREGFPVLGLRGSKYESYEVEFATLKALRDKSEDALIEFLEEHTNSKAPALKKLLNSDVEPERLQHLRITLGYDLFLEKHHKPFLNIMRDDSFGYPVVIPGGGVYVTAGADRRSTGTHYTPRSLTEPIVQYTLEPLVYDGPAEGKPREQWKLRAPKDLLALKICDMAMGSGAFLVQACRYLSERLVEAWEQLAPPGGKPRKTPEGDVSTGARGELLIPDEHDERLIFARRIIADRCLYGVDKNPMAVEMAKLSLWLITLDKGRAFTFLDHALKCGDSLLGFHSVEQVQKLHIAPKFAGRQPTFWEEHARSLYDDAMLTRQNLQAFTVVSIQDTRRKEHLNLSAEVTVEFLRVLCDLVVAAALDSADGNTQRREGAPSSAFEERRDMILTQIASLDYQKEVLNAREAIEKMKAEARKRLNSGLPAGAIPRKPFHWPLEFPEVFPLGGMGGFNVIVGNPPFQGGQKITGILGTDYRNFLVDHLAAGQRGSADLCAYFFLRARDMLCVGGGFGLLATNSIAQGDTREVGLEQIVKDGAVIPRAVPSRPWPGTAALEVAHVWTRKGKWDGPCFLDDKQVTGISPFLAIPGAVAGKPFRLKANENKSFQGSIVLGMGFILTPEDAQILVKKDKRNMDVLFPYLNGEDLNSRPDQSPSRWVINFQDWPLDRSVSGSWSKADEQERKQWLRAGRVPKDYTESVAADYPECLRIVEEKVKPERERNNRACYRDRWWHYAEKRPDLYATIRGMERVLVTSRVGSFHCFNISDTFKVFSERLVVFAFRERIAFSLLSSTLHDVWAHRPGSTTHETRNTYFPEEALETFPFPTAANELDLCGKQYDEHRRRVTIERKQGLTAAYNRFHDPDESAADIQKLRSLHVEMDLAVAAAYGWTDLKLEHGFHPTKQGVRYTISEAARREVLDRLLRLNHERYAEEVRQGLHEKKEKKPNRSAKNPKIDLPDEPTLFNPDTSGQQHQRKKTKRSSG